MGVWRGDVMMWVEGNSLLPQLQLLIVFLFRVRQDIAWNRSVIDARGRLIVNVAIPLCMPPSILGGPLSAHLRGEGVKRADN